MFRLWIAAAAIVFYLIWSFFIQATMVLVLVLIVAAGIWGWWEFRQLRKAMRTPPD